MNPNDYYSFFPNTFPFHHYRFPFSPQNGSNASSTEQPMNVNQQGLHQMHPMSNLQNWANQFNTWEPYYSMGQQSQPFQQPFNPMGQQNQPFQHPFSPMGQQQQPQSFGSSGQESQSSEQQNNPQGPPQQQPSFNPGHHYQPFQQEQIQPFQQPFNPMGQQMNPYFMNNQPRPNGGLLAHFQKEDGKLDFDKMFHTANQVTHTVKQIGPLFKFLKPK